jgi:hypothetical protein
MQFEYLPKQFNNPLKLIVGISKLNGPFAVFKGLIPTFLREIP